jgi:hypothetical protein
MLTDKLLHIIRNWLWIVTFYWQVTLDFYILLVTDFKLL